MHGTDECCCSTVDAVGAVEHGARAAQRVATCRLALLGRRRQRPGSRWHTQKLVVESLFKDNGRFYIQRGACSAYLDSPAVTLTAGRVFIRSRLSARIGMDFGDSCAGVDLASWTTVSGEPSAQGTSVRLANIRIEEVGDSNTRIVLDSGLVQTLPGAVELDVLKAVRSMLQGAGGQLQVEVLALNIESVRVAGSRLSVRFDFKVEGR